MTKATYTKPCQVATEVKSDTHRAFGCGARNRRFTLSAGQGAALSAIVVLVSCRGRRHAGPSAASGAPPCSEPQRRPPGRAAARPCVLRSEERRVGKECRSRW